MKFYAHVIVSFPSSRDVMQSQGIALQTVFESVGDALAILITLDEIFKAGDTFKEHWTQYKRYMHIILYDILIQLIHTWLI